MNSRYKYAIVKEDLQNQILEGTLKPGQKIRSEEEYAQEYQVSPITIRKALAELVNEGYITRIRKKGTYVNDNFPSLQNASHLISLIISADERFDISYMKIIKGIQAMAASQNYSVIVEWCDNVPQQEEAAVQKMLQQNIDGFLLYLSDPVQSQHTLSLIESHNIPYVLIDRCDNSYTNYYSGCDNYAGGIMATEELLKYHHSKIYFVTYHFFLPSEQARYDGFCCSLMKAGISPDSARLISSVDTEELANKIRSHEITALFCCNDRLALKIIQSLAKYELYAPQDYSIIGFDEWDESLNKSAGLTTIQQNFDEIGRNSFFLLYSAIQGILPNHNVKLLSSVSVIHRTSVGPNTFS